MIHASADRVERSAARGVFCCIPVECPVVLKGIVLNWVPSGGSGRRWSGVFPHTTSAFYRRRGYYKRPLIQFKVRKQRWNFSCSSYRCGFHPVRTEHTADCVCWVHTRSNDAAESVKRIDQSASACILNTVTGRFGLTTRSAALPSSRRRPLERCFKPEIVNRLPTLSMIRRTSLSRWSRRCWQFQRHRFACCWSTRWR